VSWGKIDPDSLPDCVVCYLDSTISLPLITAYALTRAKARKPKRLYERRDEQLEAIREQYLKVGKIEKIEHRTDLKKKPKRNLAKRASSVGLKKK
jgi:deoxyhypusine synthase